MAIKALGAAVGVRSGRRDAGFHPLLLKAQAAAAVTHPHVITIHAVGEWRGRPFLVMEFVTGVSAPAQPRIDEPRAGTIELEGAAADWRAGRLGPGRRTHERRCLSIHRRHQAVEDIMLENEA